MRNLRRTIVLASLTIALVLGAATAAAETHPGLALYPDLRTVVPRHLGLVNEHQREVLRFSNGIANTGAGPWQLRPEFQPDTTLAVQEILDAQGNVAHAAVTSVYEYHETHNHWHIGDIARFEVRAGAPDGPIVGNNSIKVTFCLIDWIRLEGNAPSSERSYFDCYTSYQGISVGWIDQYHQSTDGQQLDITGAAPGLYYLVSTANPAGVFLESDLSNNTAWTSFYLRRDSKGNPKITIVGHSPCESPGLCGEQTANR